MIQNLTHGDVWSEQKIARNIARMARNGDFVRPLDVQELCEEIAADYERRLNYVGRLLAAEQSRVNEFLSKPSRRRCCDCDE